MGIAEELKPKIRQSPPGVPVGEMLARGEAEIGFQQVSELLPVRGIEYLGPLPSDIQHFTIFSAGRHVGSKEPEAAKALIDFLAARSGVDSLAFRSESRDEGGPWQLGDHPDSLQPKPREPTSDLAVRRQ